MVYSTLETDTFLQSTQFSSNQLLIDQNLQKSQSNKKTQNKTNKKTNNQTNKYKKMQTKKEKPIRTIT